MRADVLILVEDAGAANMAAPLPDALGSLGLRADLVAVKLLGGLPQAEFVWVHGAPALQAHFDHV